MIKTYRASVMETRVHRADYWVEAKSEEEAREKMLAGETSYEDAGTLLEVTSREISSPIELES